MKTAIVILNYNDYETVYEMVLKIKSYKVLDLILIVDNDSRDNSYSMLKKLEGEKIKVIKTEKNKGYASGNNFGLKYLEEHNFDYAIISNPDIIVDSKSIEDLKNDLDNNSNISVVAPIVLEHNNKLMGTKLPGFKEDLLSNINYFHKYANRLLKYPSNCYNNKLVEVEVVSGCFFMARLNDLKKVNYFDSNTFLYYEENILGKKLKDLNLKTFIDTEVSVKHNLSISVNKSFNSLKKYKMLKSSQIYYEREYNHLNIVGIFILKLLYYISYMISYVYIFLTRRR